MWRSRGAVVPLSVQRQQDRAGAVDDFVDEVGARAGRSPAGRISHRAYALEKPHRISGLGVMQIWLPDGVPVRVV